MHFLYESFVLWSRILLTDFFNILQFLRLIQAKGTNKCQMPKFELSYFSSNSNAFFGAKMPIFMGYLWVNPEMSYFCREMELKGA